MKNKQSSTTKADLYSIGRYGRYEILDVRITHTPSRIGKKHWWDYLEYLVADYSDVKSLTDQITIDWFAPRELRKLLASHKN